MHSYMPTKPALHTRKSQNNTVKLLIPAILAHAVADHLPDPAAEREHLSIVGNAALREEVDPVASCKARRHHVHDWLLHAALAVHGERLAVSEELSVQG